MPGHRGGDLFEKGLERGGRLAVVGWRCWIGLLLPFRERMIIVRIPRVAADFIGLTLGYIICPGWGHGRAEVCALSQLFAPAVFVDPAFAAAGLCFLVVENAAIECEASYRSHLGFDLAVVHPAQIKRPDGVEDEGSSSHKDKWSVVREQFAREFRERTRKTLVTQALSCRANMPYRVRQMGLYLRDANSRIATGEIEATFDT